MTSMVPIPSLDTPQQRGSRLPSTSESQREFRRRDRSAESRSSSHHSSHHSLHHTTRYLSGKENARSRSAHSPHVMRKDFDKPEHLVYGQPRHAANWIISPKPQEHKFPKREIVVHDTFSGTAYGRSHSEGRYEYQPHGYMVHERQSRSRKVPRYIRNRSLSAHKNTIQRVHHEDNVIRAIQIGLEKRQRATRLALYQMPDPVDYEWEI